jgi:lysophospholipid acyltransferase (LPLAT)-like uncharacterized protein
MRIRSELGISVLASIFVGLLRLLFRTLKLTYREEVAGANPFDPATSEQFLYCVWHDSVVMPTFSGRHRKTSALTSRHSDGSFVARVLRLVGIQPVRGSTNRLGPAAYRELVGALGEGHVVITPDGPRGPARRMSLGILQLASRTGRRIVPTAYHSESCWRIPGSWTTLVIPRPFSRVLLLSGRPLFVPPGLDRDELREYACRLQTEMDRLNVRPLVERNLSLTSCLTVKSLTT